MPITKPEDNLANKQVKSLKITITTGDDDLRQDSEAIFVVTAQACVKHNKNSPWAHFGI